MKYLFAGLLLTISLSVFAQTEDKKSTEPKYIEVTGTAEMEVVPDMIYLDITLKDKDNKGKLSLIDIEKLMIDKFTEIGINISKDLSIKDFASNIKTYWLAKNDILLSKNYQVIVHDTKTLQKVYVELQNMGISNISISKLDHSKLTQFRRDIKVSAIKAAKEKAEALIGAINQTLGKAIYVKELDNENISNFNISNSVANSNILIRGISSNPKIDNSSPPDIEFETINLKYSILVRFEL